MTRTDDSTPAAGSGAGAQAPAANGGATGELEMEVFRAGDYGAKGVWREEDLEQLARDYAPELLEAPLTFDHARSGPAFGWVAALRRVGDRLVARLTGVPEAVRELVRTGAYKKRSVELLRRFEATGRPYLRAVTLLGAATPAVPGLRAVAFAEDDEPVCFEDDEELAMLRQTVGRLSAELASLRRERHRQHAQELISAARRRGLHITAHEAQLVESFCESFGAATEVIRFCDEEMTALEWIERLLAARAPAVPEEAFAPPRGAETFARQEAVPERADPMSIVLHRRAMALMESDPALSYAAALTAAARLCPPPAAALPTGH
jgi:hypothetical protein